MISRSRRLNAADQHNLVVEQPDAPIHVGSWRCLTAGHSVTATGACGWRRSAPRSTATSSAYRRCAGFIYRPGPLAGQPLWFDDPAFRVERHVGHVEVAPPGDEEALLRLTEDLMTALLDRSHPLWRLWFVTGLPAGRVAAVRLVTSLLDQPQATGPAENRPWVAAPPPRWRDLVRDNAQAKIAAMRRLARPPSPRRLFGWLRAGWRILAHSWRAARTSLNAPVGPGAGSPCSASTFAAAKRLAHTHGGKVNDVVLDLVAGGLRALLRSRGEPVDGLSLHAAVAVSLHTAGQAAEAGNRVGDVVVRLPMSEPDPRARLRLVCADSAYAKQSQLPTTGNGLLVWLARLGLMRLSSAANA